MVHTLYKISNRRQGKLGYLNCEIEEPISSQSNSLQKWKAKNSMVKAWLFHSMQNTINSIKNLYLFIYSLPTIKNNWDVIRDTYLDVED